MRTASPQLAWRKASFCASGECIEIAQNDDMILFRDSKDPDGPVLRYTRPEWRAFVGAIRAGEFDDLG